MLSAHQYTPSPIFSALQLFKQPPTMFANQLELKMKSQPKRCSCETTQINYRSATSPA